MKKGKIWMALGLAAALGLTGCGASSKYNSAKAASYDTAAQTPMTEEAAAGGTYYENSAMDGGAEAPAEMANEAAEAEDVSGIDGVAVSDQKLIKTVNMSMETKEFDILLSGVAAKAVELGGYVENAEVDNGSYYYNGGRRNAWLTLRIPAERLESFVSVVSEMGNVTWKSENVQDVTLEYVDVESHKKALVTEQERLMELLEKAESMEDIIQIESRLSEVRYELQSYESRLRILDNQVNYSTVSVNISEVERITEVQEKSFLEEVSYRLSNNFYNIGQGAREAAVWFLSSLPYLAMWAAAIFLIVWIIRKILCRKKERASEKEWKGWREAFRKAPKEDAEKDGNPPT